MRILFISKTADATEHFRCQIPAKYLAKAGHEVRQDYIDPIKNRPGSGIKEEDCEWADVILFQRPITEEHHKIINLIKRVRPEKVLVGEYDDDYSCVPQWNPGYSYIKAHETAWQSIVPLYDGIVASTLPLKNKLKERTTAPIEVIKNALDFEVIDKLEPFRDFGLMAPAVSPDGKNIAPMYTIPCEQFNEMMKDKTVVVWAGSRYHYFDLDWIVDEVKAAAKEDENLIFLFVGYVQLRIVKALPINRLFLAQGMTPVANYYRLLKGLRKDIAIAPVDPCEFNESKSALKIYEAMALGAYPIASEFDTYELDIEHGQLAGYEKNDWKDAILRAAKGIREGFLQEKIHENHKIVREKHDAGLRVKQYEDFFKMLIDAKRVK